MKVKNVGNQFYLTNQQFQDRLNAGTLQIGSTYHITDKNYILTSSIVDNLTTNDATKVLSAKQGKALNDSKINISDIVDNLASNDATKVLSAKQGKALNDGKVNISDIVDNLTTNDATKPLSAKQGKTLKDSVDAIEGQIDVYSLWTGTQAQYEALTPEANTLYFILEDE